MNNWVPLWLSDTHLLVQLLNNQLLNTPILNEYLITNSFTKYLIIDSIIIQAF